jgi:glycosyltransferase involved in cell wall biosynthesis
MRALSGHVLEAPNVADTALFASALEPGPADAALEPLPRPRIVFHGAITAAKLDLALLAELARLRRGWSLVLVGPLGMGTPDTDLSALTREPNVHLVGPRRHEELPSVLRGADAGLIPYAINPLTSSVFPMKVYEYLAAGLPVVSTPLPALAGVEGIGFADDAAATVAALERELAGDSPERRRERSAAAAGNSWEARIEQIEAALPSP